jgi:protein-S-isoprenylcysteine O-methyltransferase Ste14
MKKFLALAFGIVCYVVSMATMLYAALYFGNVYAPHTIDAFGAMPIGEALLINAALILGFAVQHSGMARPAVKRFAARLVSPYLVRSTYILISSLAVILLMRLWQPIGILVWHFENAAAAAMIAGIYWMGWALIVWSTFLIDHFELFGLRQVWTACNGGTCFEPQFRTPGLYRHVRHPIHLGWMIVLWATPMMTVTHLFLAIGMTVYIVAGTRLEEKCLSSRYPDYSQYTRKVPMYLPSPWRRLDP